LLRKIYDGLPESLRKPAAFAFYYTVPFPYNRGLLFARIYKQLMETQYLDEQALQSLQLERLKHLLSHAYENTGYYKKLFAKYDFQPKKIQDFSDLSVLPRIILTREEINRNFDELVAQNYKCHKILLRTGGTTRVPMNFYVSETAYLTALACTQRQWHWAGVKPKDLIFVFRGGLVTKKAIRSRRFYERINNEVYFSTSDMNESVLERYVDMINKMKPAAIRGFPSCLQIISDYIMEKKLYVFSPKAIQTSSEVLLPEQRKKIESAFNSPVFDAYGNGEHTVIATECEKHQGLHLNQEFGYTEFVKVEDSQEGENIFKVVTTSLLNDAFVFFRYDTEDLVVLAESSCSCGRKMPLIKKIMGRCGDIIRCSDGRKISPVSFANFWVDNLRDNLKGIKYVQLVQEDFDFFVVKLVGVKDSGNEKLIRNVLPLLLGKNVRLEFEYLSCVPAGKKWRVTISKFQ